MTLGRLSWRRHAWLGYVAAATVLTGLYLFAPPLAGNGPLINVLGLTSSVAIVAGIRMHRPRARAAWGLFAIGQFLFFAGDVYTYSYPKLLGADVPFPSAGDALYLLVYPALMGGLLVLVRRRNPRRDLATLIDSTILTVGVSLLSWALVIAPNIHLSGLSWLAKSVSIAYPLGDVLLLAAAIRLAVDAGRRAPAFYLLAASIVSLLVTDTAYNYALLQNTYSHQLVFDAGWIAYYVLWGAAALHPSMRTLEEPSLDHRARLTRSRLALLGLACLIAPGIRAAEQLHNADVLVVIVASGGLFLLVVARMAGLVRQEEQRASREQALRSAGVELVAAAGEDEVHAAAVSSVSTLLGDDARVSLVLFDDDDAYVVAASDTGPRPLERDSATWLRLRSGEAPAGARDDLGARAGEHVLALPLGSRDTPRGALVVCTEVAVPADVVSSLEALASQVSLASEAASLAEDLHRRRNEARFRSLVAHASDLITVLDASGVVTYQSPSVERVLGYRADEIEGERFDRLLNDSDRARLTRVLGGGGDRLADSYALECSLRHRDGTWLQFEVQHTDLLADEHVRGVVLNSRDVSERKAFEDQLAHQAFHDPVTGLANRALFSDRVQQALVRMVRGGAAVGIMFIDLDDFKTVNDSLGHEAGDQVLRDVAARLGSTLRPTDTVARFGGDEFAVLMEETRDSTEAADVAARILRALEQPFDVDGKHVFARGSIGICLADLDAGVDAEELLRNADVAMYMAKRESKGSYRVFEPTMHEHVLERLELRTDLQIAIDEGQLEVYYQPLVHLAGGAVKGVEALLRWHHPRRGTVPPAQFIPLAEESGLIIPIGRWVLETACRDGVNLGSSARAEALTISVNLSPRQLQSDSIVDDVRHALEASGLPPERLVLEITETVMMTDTELAVRRLHDLKAIGVHLALDDFGTGYSSLSYLGKFPVDILKMDRSFLASANNDSLTAAIITLGESLSLDVVAEGIELAEQADSLRDLGCDLGQGFLFARPMTHEALVEFMRGADAAEAERRDAA